MTIDSVSRIRELVSQHEAWRGVCVNLIASENVTSPLVRGLLASDLLHRYADYDLDPQERKYRGTQYIEEIERETVQLARQLFGARFVELRPIGGHIACMAGLLAVLKPGDTVMEVARDIGGHRTATKFGLCSVLSYRTVYFPSDCAAYNVDVDRSAELIREVRPRLLIFGSSNFLFPHPVKELVAVAREVGALVAYDASHVFGLIAGGGFQDPLGEGADIVMGSTHKTLPGPQGGMLLTNSEELAARIAAALYPPLVTNHHCFRIPALAACFAEMLAFGRDYAAQVVANARALGSELVRRDIPVVAQDRGFTRSHTLVISVDRFGAAEAVSRRLEENNIIVTPLLLPPALGKQGIRIGTQELTRLGARAEDMAEVADAIAAALAKDDPEAGRARAGALRARLPGISYCFDRPTANR